MKKIVFKSVVLAGVFALICSCSSEETTSTTPPVVTEDVVYNADVAPIISANCISCHSGASPQAGLLLETYAQVKAAAQSGNLYARMTNSANPMPPAGLLSSTTTQVIQDWIDDGLLED